MSVKNEQAVIALACQIVKLRDRARIWKQTALTHENEAMSARADAVARAEADRKRIAGLTEELRLERETCAETADLLNRESEKVRGLSVQAQDQRSEIERLRDEAAKYKTERDHFYQREGIEAKKRMDVEDERDALRAEVAALQERLRASITRGDFAQMEVALKSQTPKHPVKVGEWVRRTKLPGDQPVGIVKQVMSIRCDGDSYGFADGDFWSVDNCEPCTHQHPAQDGHWVRRTVASGTEPVGTMIQVQRSRTLHSEYVTRGGRVVPWAHCEPCDQPATHNTEAGKAAAESAVRTEPVAEEIKVGDVVEVFQATGSCTNESDIGTRGTVMNLDDSCVDTAPLEGYLSPKGNHVALCDVRKVTT